MTIDQVARKEFNQVKIEVEEFGNSKYWITVDPVEFVKKYQYIGTQSKEGPLKNKKIYSYSDTLYAGTDLNDGNLYLALVKYD